MIRIIFYTAFILSISTEVFGVASQPKSPIKVVQEIQSSFQKIKTIKADFSQTIRSSRFSPKKSSGKLVIERPGKMIWKYKKPSGRIFLANENSITLYDPDEKQILVSNQPEGTKMPAGLSFLMGENQLSEVFEVEVLKDKKVGGIREVTLLCKPKGKSPEFQMLELTFQWRSSIQITSSKVIDLLNTENEIVFKNMKINAKVSSKEFHPKLPKDVPVVPIGSIRP